MVHPGYADPELAEWDTYREERERELAGLCDAAVRERLAAGDIELLHFGALARPDQIRFTDALPKTRSGKIMRRLLKELAAGGEIKGDTTTLEDFTVLAKLKEQDEA